MVTLIEERKVVQTDQEDAVTYSSRVMRSFVHRVAKKKDAKVLDMGPVSDQRINFLIPHVKSVFVCDLFLQINKGMAMPKIKKNLDYEPYSFDGILLWDCLDRLDLQETEVLLEHCSSLLNDGGHLCMAAYDEFVSNPPVSSFCIKKNFDVVLKRQSHLVLPYFHRHNRDILHIMRNFTLINSYVYRSGIREFYFRRG